MRMIFKVVLASTVASFLSFASSARDAEPSLSEALAWMDSTYNSHQVNGGAFGHGVEEIYIDGKLSKRRTETFTYDGCQITLHDNDDQTSPLYSSLFSSHMYTFNLRDIDPASIKLSLLDSQHGGLSCDIDQTHMSCDIAEMEFETHNQAPLIDEDSHTVFANLQGSDHEFKNKSKTFVAVFYLDDTEYAARFVKGHLEKYPFRAAYKSDSKNLFEFDHRERVRWGNWVSLI